MTNYATFYSLKKLVDAIVADEGGKNRSALICVLWWECLFAVEDKYASIGG